jgi:hypothetical protein
MGLLKFAIGFTGVFGAVLLVLPGPTNTLFCLVMFGDTARIGGFAPDGRGYIGLLHGVLGAVMVGWAVALWGLRRYADGEVGGVGVGVGVGAGGRAAAGGEALRSLAASAAVWFALDTAYSLVVGAWQNALLNCGFGVLFAAALVPRMLRR